MALPSFAEEFAGAFKAILCLNIHIFFSKDKSPHGNLSEISACFLCCCWL